MKPSSAKAKGRKLQNEVAEAIQLVLSLPAEDVRPAVMGESGCDIKLSKRAKSVYPFDDTECKCQENLNIWAALAQSESRGARPLVVFRRNRSKTYAALPFMDLLELVRKIQHYETMAINTRYVPPSPLD